MIRLLTAAAFAALTFTAAPAFAQDEGASGEKVNQLIVYGKDPCPASVGNEITVCARNAEEERYRIPEPLRGLDQPQSDAWANKVQAYEMVGRTGPMSCSPVGGGGQSGCLAQFIDKAYAERKNGSDVQFGRLIEAEREKRLSTIDADAAADQARVEQAEKAYFEQQKRQQAERDAAQDAAGTGPTGTLPTPK